MRTQALYTISTSQPELALIGDKMIIGGVLRATAFLMLGKAYQSPPELSLSLTARASAAFLLTFVCVTPSI